MPAETLKCPMCGAAAGTEATRCEHCGARLATAVCPSCFGMLFIGQEFCPHCGAKAERQEPSESSQAEPCPRCKRMLDAVMIGGSHVRECPQCEGIWTDTETLRAICANQEQQAAVLGTAAHLPSNEGVEIEKHIRYLPCPVCGKLMNRVNFANCSGVIVDVCREHGTWFDCEELRRIVVFIHEGGMEKSRAREMESLEEDRRRAAATRVTGGQGMSSMADEVVRHGAVSAVARVVLDLMGGA